MINKITYKINYPSKLVSDNYKIEKVDILSIEPHTKHHYTFFESFQYLIIIVVNKDNSKIFSTFGKGSVIFDIEMYINEILYIVWEGCIIIKQSYDCDDYEFEIEYLLLKRDD